MYKTSTMNRFILLLLVFVGLVSTVKAEKEDSLHGDKVLFELNKQVYDNLKSPSFFKMQKDGLSEQSVQEMNFIIILFDGLFFLTIMFWRIRKNFLKNVMN